MGEEGISRGQHTGAVEARGTESVKRGPWEVQVGNIAEVTVIAIDLLVCNSDGQVGALFQGQQCQAGCVCGGWESVSEHWHQRGKTEQAWGGEWVAPALETQWRKKTVPRE